jgi:dihydroflavonol-4-reductase
VGGENLTLEDLLGRLASLTGLPAARIKVPRLLSLAVAAVSEAVEGTLLRRHPSIPLEAARMSTSRMAFDVSRARAELGYAPRPATEALESSARWFASSGLVSRRRLERMCWASGPALADAPPPLRGQGP